HCPSRFLFSEASLLQSSCYRYLCLLVETLAEPDLDSALEGDVRTGVSADGPLGQLRRVVEVEHVIGGEGDLNVRVWLVGEVQVDQTVAAGRRQFGRAVAVAVRNVLGAFVVDADPAHHRCELAVK